MLQLASIINNMATTNNRMKGVMTEIVERNNRKSEFEVFLTTEDIKMEFHTLNSFINETRSDVHKILTDAKQKYARLLRSEENVALFKLMAELETTIIQARCALATDTKLTMINQKRGGSETSYVVARAHFYNPDNVKAEMRVYLGKTEELGDDLTKLSNDKKFMDNAEKLMVKAMVEVMQKRGVTASVKKSVSVKEVVTLDGEVERINEPVEEETKKKGSFRKNPYQPGKGINPKPKGGGFPSL